MFERSGELKHERIGIVLIGRNEGARLARALDAALAQAAHHVYVDSGSSDDSVSLARAREVPVVELESGPFTAARARNAGATFLLQHVPELEFLQFIDGDCVLVAGFLERALAAMDDNARSGVVCGRRREEHPHASVYNHLTEIEWDAPIGKTNACGGDALVRVETFRQIGGYAADWIAGEDPEFCLRARRAGWEIWRIDAEMTRHDARLDQFSQWWQRSVRAGHAYAQGAWSFGGEAEHPWLHESLGIWFWGGAVWSMALL
jgi:GT2 family glycosyltransferase